MVDTGTANRPTGTTYNAATGTESVTYSTLFTSACKIQARNIQAHGEEVGERTSTAVRSELHLPVSTAPLAVGDVFTITAVATTSEVAVNTKFRVLAPFAKSFPTARRYEVEEVVS